MFKWLCSAKKHTLEVRLLKVSIMTSPLLLGSAKIWDAKEDFSASKWRFCDTLACLIVTSGGERSGGARQLLALDIFELGKEL